MKRKNLYVRPGTAPRQAMSTMVLPRPIIPRRFGSPRGFVFHYLSIRSIASITGFGSEYSFMVKINNVSRDTHRLRAE